MPQPMVPSGEIRVFSEELALLYELIASSQDVETGGELLGLWSHQGNPTIMLVSGPDDDATRAETRFQQPAGIHMAIERTVWDRFGLQVLGIWHSHHRLGLKELSTGDRNRTRHYAGAHGRARYVEFLGFIDAGGRPRIRPYLYSDAEHLEEVPAEVVELPGRSPIRAALRRDPPPTALYTSLLMRGSPPSAGSEAGAEGLGSGEEAEEIDWIGQPEARIDIGEVDGPGRPEERIEIGELDGPGGLEEIVDFGELDGPSALDDLIRAVAAEASPAEPAPSAIVDEPTRTVPADAAIVPPIVMPETADDDDADSEPAVARFASAPAPGSDAEAEWLAREILGGVAASVPPADEDTAAVPPPEEELAVLAPVADPPPPEPVDDEAGPVEQATQVEPVEAATQVEPVAEAEAIEPAEATRPLPPAEELELSQLAEEAAETLETADEAQPPEPAEEAPEPADEPSLQLTEEGEPSAAEARETDADEPVAEESAQDEHGVLPEMLFALEAALARLPAKATNLVKLDVEEEGLALSADPLEHVASLFFPADAPRSIEYRTAAAQPMVYEANSGQTLTDFYYEHVSELIELAMPKARASSRRRRTKAS